MKRILFRLAATGGLVTAFTVAQLTAIDAAFAAPPDPSGQYIVVLKSSAPASGPAAAVTRARGLGVRVDREFRQTLNGYVARLDATQLDAVRSDPDVAYVEADQVVRANATQRRPDWGLDRIDQRDRPLDHKYTYESTGARVTAYIVDTGIRTSHQDFGGRASGGFSSISDGNGTDDCNGHGTHVAGTVGGSTYGVAKSVLLVGVRVLDCNGFGTVSGVIAGVDWITANHASPAVVNMSLESNASRALDQAVRQSINAGLTYSVAAGNGGSDACDFSPARLPRAITVGATTTADSRDISYSNFGTCVDLFAPGTAVTSDWNTSDSATNTISGTSMAAPHATGVAALFLQKHPGAGPDRVRDAIVNAATPGVLTNVGDGSPNTLLYSRGATF
ncbi:S8 family peptidase [Frankia sp. QA3]|uniref:S8 family peptidase n=1 Tax=Frankia sp. QA3 TaxID=710111 RepID=UPI000269CDAA|nr:S8 family peptidase [Frankia sp. QA3]EIV96581.1 subtilisin-like serine protease [Frankia sp. QA3]